MPDGPNPRSAWHRPRDGRLTRPILSAIDIEQCSGVGLLIECQKEGPKARSGRGPTRDGHTMGTGHPQCSPISQQLMPMTFEVAKGLLPPLAWTGGKTCHRQQMGLRVGLAAGWSPGVIGPCKRPAPVIAWVAFWPTMDLDGADLVPAVRPDRQMLKQQFPVRPSVLQHKHAACFVSRGGFFQIRRLLWFGSRRGRF